MFVTKSCVTVSSPSGGSNSNVLNTTISSANCHNNTYCTDGGINTKAAFGATTPKTTNLNALPPAVSSSWSMLHPPPSHSLYSRSRCLSPSVEQENTCSTPLTGSTSSDNIFLPPTVNTGSLPITRNQYASMKRLRVFSQPQSPESTIVGGQTEPTSPRPGSLVSTKAQGSKSIADLPSKLNEIFAQKPVQKTNLQRMKSITQSCADLRRASCDDILRESDETVGDKLLLSPENVPQTPKTYSEATFRPAMFHTETEKTPLSPKSRRARLKKSSVQSTSNSKSSSPIETSWLTNNIVTEEDEENCLSPRLQNRFMYLNARCQSPYKTIHAVSHSPPLSPLKGAFSGGFRMTRDSSYSDEQSGSDEEDARGIPIGKNRSHQYRDMTQISPSHRHSPSAESYNSLLSHSGPGPPPLSSLRKDDPGGLLKAKLKLTHSLSVNNLPQAVMQEVFPQRPSKLTLSSMKQPQYKNMMPDLSYHTVHAESPRARSGRNSEIFSPSLYQPRGGNPFSRNSSANNTGSVGSNLKRRENCSFRNCDKADYHPYNCNCDNDSTMGVPSGCIHGAYDEGLGPEFVLEDDNGSIISGGIFGGSSGNGPPVSYYGPPNHLLGCHVSYPQHRAVSPASSGYRTVGPSYYSTISSQFDGAGLGRLVKEKLTMSTNRLGPFQHPFYLVRREFRNYSKRES